MRCGSGDDRLRTPWWKRWSRQLVAGWLLASVSAVSADGWQIRGWHLEEGLPDGTITTMAQGPDGCLWLGTPSGVVRFDGARFKRMENIPEAEIAGLAFDRDGVLWIAGKSGRAFVYRNGKAGEVGGSVKAGGHPLSFPAWTGHALLAPCASGGMWVWAERGDPVVFRADRPMDRDDWRGVAEGSVVAEASGSVWALRGNDLRCTMESDGFRMPCRTERCMSPPAPIRRMGFGPSRPGKAADGCAIYQARVPLSGGCLCRRGWAPRQSRYPPCCGTVAADSG